MITNLFGCREIQAYVTATEKEPLNQTGSDRMKYIPLFSQAVPLSSTM